MSKSIASILGGVEMKTIDEVKPVVDKAVEDAKSLRLEIEDTKDIALGKDSAQISGKISEQDVPETANKQDIAVSVSEPEIAQEASVQSEAYSGPDMG